MRKLIIFAGRFEQAVQYAKNNDLKEYEWYAPRNIQGVLGLTFTRDDLIKVGDWYCNEQVVIAYEYALQRARRNDASDS